MRQRSNGAPDDPARVLLFSLRHIEHHVARCQGYEFEDVIRSCESTDVIAPSLSTGGSRIGRYARSLFGEQAPRIDGTIHVDKEYELFFAYCSRDWDIRYLRFVEGLRDKCRRLVCVIGELWPVQLASSLPNLRLLRNFDCIFSGLESSVDAIQTITGRPCYFLPYAVDALRFSPYPRNAERSIDVYNMGRRHAELHRALVARAAAGELFYVYDTAGDFSVLDPREHRLLLANLIKRSRYFIAYPPKFDVPHETTGLHELGARFFEGVAGGAVVLGAPPRCAAYESCFDWQDAVISTASDGGQIGAVIADLDANPRRVARLRRNNVVNSLQRHDWVYRWRQILDRLGLTPSRRAVERERCLERQATAVGAADDESPADCAT